MFVLGADSLALEELWLVVSLVFTVFLLLTFVADRLTEVVAFEEERF
ncbi:Hypothetical protein ADU71_1213 [Pediococcus damnosus]|nr:Hypothetical protein ADU69_1140 [Pediococcus damnosus]AMV65109.1 Hypothetical protein ADU71_1213 [Pediococcus damnosus]